MSLRARLVAAVVVLATVGLSVAGVATYVALRSFLLDRMDEQLTRSVPLFQTAFRQVQFGGGPEQPTDLPVGAFAELRSLRGVDRLSVSAVGEAELPTPDLPADIRFDDDLLVWFTLPAADGFPAYRVRAQQTPSGELELVIAAPLDQVHSTLRRLVVIEVVVLGGVLAVLSVLSWWAVGVGLRPLRRIEATAGLIAEGDLSRRVDVHGGGTEVERLGASFNTMVDRIETAFGEKDSALAAKAVSEEKLRRFVADASHELRTPLTSIRAHAELFRRGAADRPEDLAVVMRRIEDEAARMGVLVDDLLLLARLDQGRPLERAPVELAVVAADAVADARAVEPDRPITVEADPTVVVEGDDARLRQVVANLLANVREHTPAATPVTVRVRAEHGRAVLEVADRGPGLSAADAARVFERFYRADGSRARSTGGSGLGLSIVAAIAAAHGGAAEVRSAPGEGATFAIRLPRAGEVDTGSVDTGLPGQEPVGVAADRPPLPPPSPGRLLPPPAPGPPQP